MSYYKSSDYCGCTLGRYLFYYGYEETDGDEWCFTCDLITDDNEDIRIAKYKSSELTGDNFELAPNLFAGINKMFNDGLIEIKVNV
jgi:hypothetical protein